MGKGRFTKHESNMIKLAPFQFSVMIGLILSDGYIRFGSVNSKNAMLEFKQSISHSGYL